MDMQKLPKLNPFVKEILEPLILKTARLGSHITFLEKNSDGSEKHEIKIKNSKTELGFLKSHITDIVKVACYFEIEKERKTAAEHLEDGECQHNIADEFVKLVLHREIFGDKEIFGENEENYVIWTEDWFEEMQKRRKKDNGCLWAE